LKAGHLIEHSDLRSPIDRIPRVFRVDPKVIVGKYLKNDIDSGKPIWQNSVSSAPMVSADTQGYVVQVRLAEGTAPAKFLQPKSKVVLSSTESTDKREGVIIGTVGKSSPRGSKGETGATGKDKTSPQPSTQSSPDN
jgi:flagella basal body P-ring formation protein FlgA